MNKNYLILLFGYSLLVPMSNAYGQQHEHKSYHLFNPAPKEKMRDMETDRPDVTESPFTVDAGHFQYESDLLRFKHEKDELTDQKTLLINQANLKLGITTSTDIQLIVQSFGRQEEKELISGKTTISRGFGDLTLRIKQNLLGNNSGNLTLAILPYVKFPTAHLEQQNRFEGGLIVPFQLKLPSDWTLGLQVEADRLKDKYSSALHSQLLQSLTISHQILKKLDGIAETYYTYDFKQHDWANFLNAAVQFEITSDFKLDAGLNYGIQEDAEKNYFIGTSFRF